MVIWQYTNFFDTVTLVHRYEQGEFNVHGSVQRNNILVYKSQQDAHVTEFIFCLRNALHVSGFTITHLQEHKTNVTTASGNHCTVLLSAATVEDLELVWMCCEWRMPPTAHSNQFQLFHESSRQQYGVMVTRCCSYSCLCSWRWVIVTPETCRAVVR